MSADGVSVLCKWTAYPAFFTKPVQNFQILILAFGRSIGEAMFLTKA